MINLPYINAPVGFEGDNGLFLQGDVFQSTLRDAVGMRGIQLPQMVLLLPVPELYLRHPLPRHLRRDSEFLGDDDLTVINALTGLPDPTKQATYTTTAHNHIIAPQFGLDYTHPVGMWLALNVQGKAAPGLNIVENDVVLERGDGLIGRQGGNDGTAFSTVLELGANLDVYITPHCRIRPATIASGCSTW